MTTQDPDRKECSFHGITEQHGIYCNRPMGTRLACGLPLVFIKGDERWTPGAGDERRVSERLYPERTKR